MSHKNIYQKINISLPALVMTGGLSLGDKIKDYVDRNNRVQVYSLHEVTQLGKYSQRKCSYSSGRTKKINFSKTKIYFHKKTTPQL